MTRWGFCDGLGVYDVLERRLVKVFMKSMEGGLLKI